MSWYTPVLSFLETSGKWMEKNPTAASLIGGAFAGGAKYYADSELQKEKYRQEEKMYDRRKKDELDNARASSGNTNYGSHADALVGGSGGLFGADQVVSSKKV